MDDEKNETEHWIAVLFAGDAKALRSALQRDMERFKPCIKCGDDTLGRGVFMPTTPQEKMIVADGQVLIYGLCSSCLPISEAERDAIDGILLSQCPRPPTKPGCSS